MTLRYYKSGTPLVTRLSVIDEHEVEWDHLCVAFELNKETMLRIVTTLDPTSPYGCFKESMTCQLGGNDIDSPKPHAAVDLIFDENNQAECLLPLTLATKNAYSGQADLLVTYRAKDYPPVLLMRLYRLNMKGGPDITLKRPPLDTSLSTL